MRLSTALGDQQWYAVHPRGSPMTGKSSQNVPGGGTPERGSFLSPGGASKAWVRIWGRKDAARVQTLESKLFPFILELPRV